MIVTPQNYNPLLTKNLFPKVINKETLEAILGKGIISNYFIAANTIFAKNLVVGNQTWNSNVSWSTALSTLSWNSHTLFMADGTQTAILSGSASLSVVNTPYYIYWLKGTTTYASSTVFSDALGDDRIHVNTARKDITNIVTFGPTNNSGTVISGNNITTGKIQSTDSRTFFDLNASKIQMSDATNPRIVLNGSDGSFKISKSGFDANTTGNANLVLKASASETLIFTNRVITTYMENVQQQFDPGVGRVQWYSGKNWTVLLRFYKESNFTITGAVLNLIFYDNLSYFDGVSFVSTKAKNVVVRLNPSRSTIFYSSGTALESSFNISSDGETKTHTLSGGSITSISNGWNTIAVQQETEDTVGDKAGYCVASLSITGYLTI